MNLQKKLFLILFLSLTFCLTFLYLISSNVILNGFVQIEDKQIEKNIERLQEIILDEQEVIKTTMYGWSTWDESYNFIKKPNAYYLKSTYGIDSVFDNKFSEIVIFDLKGKVLFAQDYDLEERKFITPDPERIKDLEENLIKAHPYKKTHTPFSGLYSYKNNFDFFSMNPILPGSAIGEPNGYLVFFRKIDKSIIARYERIIKFKIQPTVIANTKLDKIQTSFIRHNHETVATIVFPDVLNRNSLSIQMSMPRSIYQYGKKTLSNYLLLISALAFIMLVLIYSIFNRYIIKRILRLKKELNEISQEKSQKKNVTVDSPDEIGKLSAKINETLNVIEQNQILINRSSKLSALGEMAGSIAHEINNPLTIISGYSSRISTLVKEPEINKELVVNHSKKIIATVLRIEKIIKSLSVISRDTEFDQLMVVSIGSLFEDVIPLCQTKLKIKNIKLDISGLENEIELEIRPVQIAQVLINLINNAIDALEHTPSPVIKIYTEKIQDEVVISVCDNGPEIPLEISKKMMLSFFTTKEIGKGTGLGLSISRNIVEKHHGRLELTTKPQTCLKIILPIKKASEEA